jgi:hypothetical protein
MIPYVCNSPKEIRVIAYKSGLDFIVVQFSDLSIKKYTNRKTGISVVLLMKSFAHSQYGLSEFIAENNPEFE